jgi:hypothetical protein
MCEISGFITKIIVDGEELMFRRDGMGYCPDCKKDYYYMDSEDFKTCNGCGGANVKKHLT